MENGVNVQMVGLLSDHNLSMNRVLYIGFLFRASAFLQSSLR
jgi:hypothetical protein